MIKQPQPLQLREARSNVTSSGRSFTSDKTAGPPCPSPDPDFASFFPTPDLLIQSACLPLHADDRATLPTQTLFRLIPVVAGRLLDLMSSDKGDAVPAEQLVYCYRTEVRAKCTKLLQVTQRHERGPSKDVETDARVHSGFLARFEDVIKDYASLLDRLDALRHGIKDEHPDAVACVPHSPDEGTLEDGTTLVGLSPPLCPLDITRRTSLEEERHERPRSLSPPLCEGNISLASVSPSLSTRMTVVETPALKKNIEDFFASDLKAALECQVMAFVASCEDEKDAESVATCIFRVFRHDVPPSRLFSLFLEQWEDVGRNESVGYTMSARRRIVQLLLKWLYLWWNPRVDCEGLIATMEPFVNCEVQPQLPDLYKELVQVFDTIKQSGGKYEGSYIKRHVLEVDDGALSPVVAEGNPANPISTLLLAFLVKAKLTRNAGFLIISTPHLRKNLAGQLTLMAHELFTVVTPDDIAREKIHRKGSPEINRALQELGALHTTLCHWAIELVLVSHRKGPAVTWLPIVELAKDLFALNNLFLAHALLVALKECLPCMPATKQVLERDGRYSSFEELQGNIMDAETRIALEKELAAGSKPFLPVLPSTFRLLEHQGQTLTGRRKGSLTINVGTAVALSVKIGVLNKAHERRYCITRHDDLQAYIRLCLPLRSDEQSSKVGDYQWKLLRAMRVTENSLLESPSKQGKHLPPVTSKLPRRASQRWKPLPRIPSSATPSPTEQ